MHESRHLLPGQFVHSEATSANFIVLGFSGPELEHTSTALDTITLPMWFIDEKPPLKGVDLGYPKMFPSFNFFKFATWNSYV